ncbi:hypothetical protein WN48_03373 [Eufriesea mexicana]|uniref:Uncharacterized protein n=1 Tax=Eufriesea mexicana TaxID=516756 RepID=A0A310SF33_9HYME|nr:hypothetical protein WN48_03373 [Eufriesea mexicana]
MVPGHLGSVHEAKTNPSTDQGKLREDYDLKKRGSHTCDMQALQPLPVPTTTTTNTAPAMTTSGGQPPLPVSETA